MKRNIRNSAKTHHSKRTIRRNTPFVAAQSTKHVTVKTQFPLVKQSDRGDIMTGSIMVVVMACFGSGSLM
jgi:hypothetical protein